MKTTSLLLLLCSSVAYFAVPGEQRMIARGVGHEKVVARNHNDSFSKRDEAYTGCNAKEPETPEHIAKGNSKNNDQKNSPEPSKVKNPLPPSVVKHPIAPVPVAYGSGDGNTCGIPLAGLADNVYPIAIGADIFGKGEACGACIEIDPGSKGPKTKVYGE
jgi:hypothetical protein